jgi:vitamin B12 transporter
MRVVNRGIIMTIALILAAAAAISPDIVVTAALEPVRVEDAASSITVVDEKRIEALGAPLVSDFIRLSPGVSVSVNGAQGAFTEVRIRGAEANHTLLFVDGIAFNDPAAGNAARFENFAADGLSQIEILRGPQSALWGSEALGGVIALAGTDPLAGTHVVANGEYGTHDFSRANFAAATGSERAGIAATASWVRSDGIDILGGGNGDRDGFKNITASLKAVARPGSDGEIGIVGRYIRADSQFDNDFVCDANFVCGRGDTLDASRAELGAVRAWARLGLAADAPWSFEADGQYLHSSNRHRDGATPLDRSLADRLRIGGKLIRRFAVAGTAHALIASVEREDENFAALNQAVFFAPDQRRSRGRTAYIGEWRADWGRLIATDVAVRHDDFNRFADATTLRASLLVRPTDGLTLHAAYGEGIAQPTLFDLYGFDPTRFVGNPNLSLEKSRGYEAGIRWESARFAIGVTAFDNRLTDEIVSVSLFDDQGNFTGSTTDNASGRSRRRGIEASAELRPMDGLRISANYTYLDAKDQQISGGAQLRETRRPKHTANLAADWSLDRLTVGGSLAYVGKHDDRDFDLGFSGPIVTLHDYVLAGARIAYRVTEAIELFGRVENAGDAHYQDVVGYATPGRTFHAGARVRLGD